MIDRPRRRKLLVASVGIASVSYVVGVACLDSTSTSGNLPAPPPTDGATQDAREDVGVISGNLPAPPPPENDAGEEDASDAAAEAGEDADGG